MKIELNEKDSIRFAKALLTPRKPKKATLKALARYRMCIMERHAYEDGIAIASSGLLADGKKWLTHHPQPDTL